MKKTILSLFLVFLFFESCSNAKSLIISQESLDNNIQFEIVKENELRVKNENDILKISNLEKFCKQENYWYAFFNIENEKKKQILVVFDLNKNSYDYCDYYPETSYLFEDELICFSIKTEPEQYPLPESYEITTLIKDFKNQFEKTTIEKSRYDLSRINGIQDFYYRKPYFFVSNNGDISKNLLSAVDRKYKENDKVYFVVWEQAHFPIASYYYYINRKRAGSACAYPALNDSDLYRIPEDEFVSIDDLILDNKFSTEIKDEKILSIIDYDEYIVSIICNTKKSSNYDDYKLRISNGDNIKEYELSKIFLYQDSLEKIELARGRAGGACCIITTSVFSYDLFIDFLTGQT